MSKVDPNTLKKLDRRSTILLEASHRNTELGEKSISGLEDPGMDALRGTFGAVGSIVRARSARRMSKMSNTTTGSAHGHGPRHGGSGQQLLSAHGMESLPRHQLYDAPVPKAHPPLPEDAGERISMFSQMAQPGTPTLGATPGVPSSPNTNRKRIQSIKFEQKDVAHYYPSPGIHGEARHEEQPSHLPPIPASESTASLERSPFSPTEEASVSSFPPRRHRSSTSGSPVIPHPTQSPLYGSAYMDPFSDERTVSSPKTMQPSSTLSTLGSQDTRDPLSSSESDPEERQKNIERGFRKTARGGAAKYPSPVDQNAYKDEVRSLVHGRTESECTKWRNSTVAVTTSSRLIS
jgi:magnesium transporter